MSDSELTVTTEGRRSFYEVKSKLEYNHTLMSQVLISQQITSLVHHLQIADLKNKKQRVLETDYRRWWPSEGE